MLKNNLRKLNKIKKNLEVSKQKRQLKEAYKKYEYSLERLKQFIPDKEEIKINKNKKYRFLGNLVDDDDLWFAWYPVSTGAFGTGRIVWLNYVIRKKTMFDTIYQALDK